MTRERKKPAEGSAYRQAFSFGVEGDLWVEAAGDAVAVRDSFDFAAGLQSYFHDGETEIPRALFTHRLMPEQFGREVAQFFFQHLGGVLAETLSLHLNDAVHFALAKLQIDEIDLRKQAEGHGRQVAEVTRERFGTPSTGIPSQWERRELGRAVRDALRSVGNARCRTLEKVAEKLRAEYPDKGPPNGEALRKLLGRHRLSWRELKSGRFIG